jgi:hypothetical protein
MARCGQVDGDSGRSGDVEAPTETGAACATGTTVTPCATGTARATRVTGSRGRKRPAATCSGGSIRTQTPRATSPSSAALATGPAERSVTLDHRIEQIRSPTGDVETASGTDASASASTGGRTSPARLTGSGDRPMAVLMGPACGAGGAGNGVATRSALTSPSIIVCDDGRIEVCGAGADVDPATPRRAAGAAHAGLTGAFATGTPGRVAPHAVGGKRQVASRLSDAAARRAAAGGASTDAHAIRSGRPGIVVVRSRGPAGTTATARATHAGRAPAGGVVVQSVLLQRDGTLRQIQAATRPGAAIAAGLARATNSAGAAVAAMGGASTGIGSIGTGSAALAALPSPTALSGATSVSSGGLVV